MEVAAPGPDGTGREPPAYPTDLEMALHDEAGDRAEVRPIRRSDAGALAEFHRALSARSVCRRFFFDHPALSPGEVERLTAVDYRDRLALVARIGGRLTALARYDRVPGTDEAEMAFVVADEHQRHGIGRLLRRQLATAAARRGVRTFVAYVLPNNRDMVGLLTGSGHPITTRLDQGVVVRTSIRAAVVPAPDGPG